MNQKELLGKRIKELRRNKGITQDYLAEKLNIEPRQLSKLETGKHYPSFETIIAILETFNITFEELINYEHLDSQKDYKELIIKEITELDSNKAPFIYKILRSIVN